MKRLSRQSYALRRVALALTFFLVMSLLAACGSATNTAAPVATTAAGGASSAATTAPAATTAANTSATTAPAAAATGDPIKIGVVVSATGGNAPLGEPQRNSFIMAEEQLNKKGGINGRPIKMIILDDESKDDLGAAHAKKLINDDKVVAVIGSSGSGPSLAMAPIAEEAQTPMLSMGSNIKLVRPVQKWVFKSPPNDDLYFNHLLDYFKEKNYKKIGFIHDANAYGTGGRDFLQQLAPQRGFEITSIESFDGKAVDMKPQLTKIAATKPDVIVCWGTNPGPAIVTKNRQELGIDIPLFHGGGAANQQFLDLAGDAANGVLITGGKILVPDAIPAGDPVKPLLTQYLKDYKEKFGKDTNQFGSLAWDNFLILTNAIAKAGVDKAKIREAIETTTNFVGTQAVYNFSAQDHNGLGKSALVMVEVKNKNWSFVSDWK